MVVEEKSLWLTESGAVVLVVEIVGSMYRALGADAKGRLIEDEWKELRGLRQHLV